MTVRAEDRLEHSRVWCVGFFSGSTRKRASRRRLRSWLFASSRGFPRNADSVVEAVIHGNVSIIDAHKPTVAALAPANSLLFKKRSEPPPYRGILGISSQSGRRSR